MKLQFIKQTFHFSPFSNASKPCVINKIRPDIKANKCCLCPTHILIYQS